jgi:hypothetical protein
MNTALKEALVEAYACAPSNVAVLETLEVSHPSLPGGTLYLVKNLADLTFTLEDTSTQLFKACGFNITLPAAGDSGLQELNIAIDNIDRAVSDFVYTASTYEQPVKLVYRPYLSDDLTTPQMDPPLELYLTDVSVTLFQVTGKATFVDVINTKFPADIYTRARFPSLGD